MRRFCFLASLLMLFIASASMVMAAQMTGIERVGRKLYMDTGLSLNRNQSCMTCHHPSAGFADPANRLDPSIPVSDGSDPELFGGANAPSSAYAGFSPILEFVCEGGDCLWIGGMFWNGRATGWRLEDPLAEQALGPFLNPREMGLASMEEVVSRVQASSYAREFERVFSDPAWGWMGWGDVEGTYDLIGRAIAEFERSQTVTRFSSLFDRFYSACRSAGIDVADIGIRTPISAVPQGILSPGQLKGLALFNRPNNNDGILGDIDGVPEGGNCAACHPSGASMYDPAGRALFTDFSYDNLGIPTNWKLYALLNAKLLPGETEAEPPDLGLGGFLATVDLAGFPGAVASDEYGKFKVPTLRNVAKSPPYGHNGYFVTLKEIVGFYNLRTEAPEYAATMNTDELGDLGLSPQDINNIVAFLKTLND